MSNPHHKNSISLQAILTSILKHRQLIFQMAKREVVGRYKGSILGLAWSFFNPLLMLIIYTFVFTVIFKSRWIDNSSESKTDFALILFAGMIVYNFFAEAINRAPTTIIGNVNYVKKVIFPLEILPIITLGAASFHFLVSLSVLLIAILLCDGQLYWSALYLPLVMLPLLMCILGLSWFLASIGVYMRDVSQTIGIFTTALLFISPVFYSIEALPIKYQKMAMLNPLSFVIEQMRSLLIHGGSPNFKGLFIYAVISMIVMWLGFFWFQKTRKGFADVL